MWRGGAATLVLRARGGRGEFRRGRFRGPLHGGGGGVSFERTPVRPARPAAMRVSPRPFPPALAAAALLFAPASLTARQFPGGKEPEPDTPAAWAKEAGDLRMDDAGAAVPLYLRALAADPASVAGDLWGLGTALEDVGRGGEHLPLVAAVPTTDWGDGRYGGGFPSVLLHFENTFRQYPEATLAALRTIWEREPAVRPRMLDRMNDERFWRNEPFFTAGLDRLEEDPIDGLRPSLGVVLNTVLSSGGGKRGWAAELLDAAAHRDRLGEVAARLRGGLVRDPDWAGGRALLAAVRARRGDAAGAADFAGPLIPTLTAAEAWAFSTLLGDSDAALELALAAQRRAVAEGAREREERAARQGGRFGRLPFFPGDRSDDGAEWRLIELLGRSGRYAEARRLLRNRAAAASAGADRSGAAGRPPHERHMAAERTIGGLLAVARGALDAGLPVDALRLARRAAADPHLWAAIGVGGMEVDIGLRQGAERLAAEAAEAVTPATALRHVRLSGAAREFGLAAELTDGGNDGVYSYRPNGAGLAAAGVSSPVLDALAADPAARAAARDLYDGLAELSDPPDPAVDAAQVVLAAADGDAAVVAAAAGGLAAGAATADGADRDRIAAWYLAGAAAARVLGAAESGATLRTAALAAAERGDGIDAAVARFALLTQAGRDAAARGDLDDAADRWGELGAALLGGPLPPAGGPGPDGRTDGQRAIFLLELAGMAADAGLPGLSMRLVRAALGGGPPTPYQQKTPGELLFAPPEPDRRARRVMFSHRRPSFRTLRTAWERAGADPAAVAGLLLDLSLPADEPGTLRWTVGTGTLAAAAEAGGVRDELDRRVAALPTDGADAAGENLFRVGLAVRDRDEPALIELLDRLRAAVPPPPGPEPDPPPAADGGDGDDRRFVPMKRSSRERRAIAGTARTAADAATDALDAGLATDPAFDLLTTAVATLDAADTSTGYQFLRRLAAERFARARAGGPGEGADAEAAEGARLVLRAVDLSMNGYGSSPRQVSRQYGMQLAEAVTRLAAADLPAAAAVAFEAAGERVSIEPNRVSGRTSDVAGPPPPLAADLNRAAAALPPGDRFAALLGWTFPPGGDGSPRIRTAVSPRPGFDDPAADHDGRGYRFFGPDPPRRPPRPAGRGRRAGGRPEPPGPAADRHRRRPRPGSAGTGPNGRIGRGPRRRGRARPRPRRDRPGPPPTRPGDGRRRHRAAAGRAADLRDGPGRGGRRGGPAAGRDAGLRPRLSRGGRGPARTGRRRTPRRRAAAGLGRRRGGTAPRCSNAPPTGPTGPAGFERRWPPTPPPSPAGRRSPRRCRETDGRPVRAGRSVPGDRARVSRRAPAPRRSVRGRPRSCRTGRRCRTRRWRRTPACRRRPRSRRSGRRRRRSGSAGRRPRPGR